MNKQRQFKGHINKARETCSIIIRDKLTFRPLFRFIFYGITMSELCTVGEDLSGGDIVAAALQRRGLNPEDFHFMIWDAMQ